MPSYTKMFAVMLVFYLTCKQGERERGAEECENRGKGKGKKLGDEEEDEEEAWSSCLKTSDCSWSQDWSPDAMWLGCMLLHSKEAPWDWSVNMKGVCHLVWAAAAACRLSCILWVEPHQPGPSVMVAVWQLCR